MTAVKTRQDRFGRTHRRLLVLSVALAIAVAAAVSTTWAHEGPVGFRVLIVQHAANGTLQTVPGRSDLRLTLNGVEERQHAIEAATNLSAPITWTALATNATSKIGTFNFTDLSATNFPRRFYRAREF